VTAPRWDEEGPTPVRLPDPVLSVDPERVDGMLRELRALTEEVWSLERAITVTRILSPADDPVSVNAAEQSTLMMERARHFLATWRDNLIQAQRAIEEQRAAYQAADSAMRA